jgi:hypothetical protein
MASVTLSKRFNTKILFTLFTLAFSFNAFSGGTSGGGGVGVRCDGKLKSLDRYEAELLRIKLVDPKNFDEARNLIFDVIDPSSKKNPTEDRLNPNLPSEINSMVNAMKMEGEWLMMYTHEINRTSNLKLSND